MAKKKRKKRSGGKKRRVSAKQRAAARRNIKKAQAARRAKYGSKKRRHGGKKRKSKKKGRKRGYARHKAYSGGAVAARARFNALVKRLEAKGHDPKTAQALAHRAQRQMAGLARAATKHRAGVAAQQAALSNLFGGIAAAGQLEAMRR